MRWLGTRMDARPSEASCGSEPREDLGCATPWAWSRFSAAASVQSRTDAAGGAAHPAIVTGFRLTMNRSSTPGVDDVETTARQQGSQETEEGPRSGTAGRSRRSRAATSSTTLRPLGGQKINPLILRAESGGAARPSSLLRCMEIEMLTNSRCRFARHLPMRGVPHEQCRGCHASQQEQIASTGLQLWKAESDRDFCAAAGSPETI